MSESSLGRRSNPNRFVGGGSIFHVVTGEGVYEMTKNDFEGIEGRVPEMTTWTEIF